MNRRQVTLIAVAAIALAILIYSTLRSRAAPYEWVLPDNAPHPLVPADNPITTRKVELGRWLFYDQRLSINDSFGVVD